MSYGEYMHSGMFVFADFIIELSLKVSESCFGIPEVEFRRLHVISESIREITSWEQRKLGDIADVTKLAGFEFTEHIVYSDEGSIIALRGLNVKNGQLVLDDVKYIDGSNFSKLGRSKLYENDVLFTYVGTVGELAIIPENEHFYLALIITGRRSRLSGGGGATCPDFRSHPA